MSLDILYRISDPCQDSWAKATFVNVDDAQVALNEDRSDFILRSDIMEIIPKPTRRRIIHPRDEGQIKGFEDLFDLLELPASEGLRRIITDYFAQKPALRKHLSQLLSTISFISTLISNTVESC